MSKPVITKECVKPLFESKFIKVFDLQYKEGAHYYDATRRDLDNITAVKSDEQFRTMLPDAVTCVVILTGIGDEPRLLLSQEYRYPAGQFLLSPPAGLIDPEDRSGAESADSSDEDRKKALFLAAGREIKEETGLDISEGDRMFVINPHLFSTPGMTDESNALVGAVIDVKDEAVMSQDGAVGSELFDGFVMLTRDEARKVLKEGRDSDGKFYSVYTWAALMYFVSNMWME